VSKLALKIYAPGKYCGLTIYKNNLEPVMDNCIFIFQWRLRSIRNVE
jgi:hypothetical protein